MEKIRLLNAEEIECRVGIINEKGLSLLLYKDARVDMKILDEAYGANNWQREHVMIGSCLYCIVKIWDESKKQWISKMDVGTKSYTESEKGEASDSFKRACFSVGIGRELYTAPFIWIPSSKASIVKKNDKYVTCDKFKVTDISYTESREISRLVICNQKGQEVYRMNQLKQVDGLSDQTAQMHRNAINRELERTGVALDAVLLRYGVNSVQEMDEATYKKAIAGLKRTKTKAA